MTDDEILILWQDLNNAFMRRGADRDTPVIVKFARALLATPAPLSDEPVAIHSGHGAVSWLSEGADLPEGALLYAAPLAQSAEQDRIDAELRFLDDDEIAEAANKFRLGNPRFDTLRCFVNYVIIVAQHKGASK
jgi:hypothetical protein